LIDTVAAFAMDSRQMLISLFLEKRSGVIWMAMVMMCLLLCTAPLVHGQQSLRDSLLRLEPGLQPGDTQSVTVLLDLATTFQNSDPSKGLIYAEKALRFSQMLTDKRWLALSLNSRGTLHFLKQDYGTALEDYKAALAINLEAGDHRQLARNYNNLGLVYTAVTDYPKALDHYLLGLKFNELSKSSTGLINNLGNIGNLYNSMNEQQQALGYFSRAIELCDEATPPLVVAGLLNNIGNSYTQLNNLDLALDYKLRALAMSEQSGSEGRIANSLGNLGHLYLRMDRLPESIRVHKEALEIQNRIRDRKGLLSNYLGLSNAYWALNEVDSAAYYTRQAKALAEALSDIRSLAASLEKISQYYDHKGLTDSAFFYFREFTRVKGSMENEQSRAELAQISMKHQFGRREDSLLREQLIIDNQLKEKILLSVQQQKELELQKTKILLAERQKELQELALIQSQSDLALEQSARSEKERQLEIAEKERILQGARIQLQEAQLDLRETEIRRARVLRTVFVAGLLLLGAFLFFLYRSYTLQKRSGRIIQAEKEKSENLLLNILPPEVAKELKEHGQCRARMFDEVTVLFSDFVGFTRVAEQMQPDDLVRELNICFSAFDAIMEKYGIEKIKTIGDAYMAVSGLPVHRPDHALQAARAAEEMAAFMENRNRNQETTFAIRIGIHSGPVVAGIVGRKKFAYDVWGDTVNVAARMESASEPGKINISAAVASLLGNALPLEYRGTIPVKNKGDMDMYFVSVKQA
jgi:adenylate cyclase